MLQKVERIMYNFLSTAQTLHIDDIMKLNESMSAPDIGLPDKKLLK